MAICDKFWQIVDRAVRQRVEALLPLPDTTVAYVRFLPSASAVELTQPLENTDMADKIDLTLAGDALYGYLLRGVTFMNKAGNPVDPAPAADTVSVVSADDAIATGTYVGEGKIHIMANDNATPGSAVRLVVSADATGDQDDAWIDITIGADRFAAVNVGSATLEELTGPLTPPEPAITPVPTDPNADPA